MPLPEFATWINPLLTSLRELGGSARPREVVDRVARDQRVADAVLDRENQGGVSRFTNQVHWARYYLAEAGFIDRSQHGVWRLTEKAQSCGILTDNEIRALVDEVQLNAAGGRVPVIDRARAAAPAILAATAPARIPDDVDTAPEEDDTNHRSKLLRILKSLTPSGFERLCQRLLREAGFEQVVVTGRSGDGGIDGHGVLALNAFVSFRVLFQCKRYEGVVTPSQVRDFRGALQGRADKGMILTTGSFTTEARREAVRDGAPQIELVDGEKLVELFEQLELGVKPRKAYDVDERFFAEYQA
jgi:restriction system protein